MNKEIAAYNRAQNKTWQAICIELAKAIEAGLPKAENEIWHGSPVWFIEGNPVAGYAARKKSVQLLFWSGQSFDEPGLNATGSFKAAEFQYTSVDQINLKDIKRWLKKAKTIQWDYKNIVKRHGKLVKIV